MAADGAIVDDVELTVAWRALRVNSTDQVVLRDLHIHHIGRTGIEVQNHSVGAVVEGCRIHDTGLAGEGNAEAVYIGSARSSTGWSSPDLTRDGTVRGCTLGPNIPEGIDLKDDAHGWLLTGNTVTGAGEINSGAINVRGRDNALVGNLAEDNDGAGFRFGGTPSGVARNHVRDNVSVSNGGVGFKCIDGPQLTFSGNSGSTSGTCS